jgi:hypothetical protein
METDATSQLPSRAAHDQCVMETQLAHLRQLSERIPPIRVWPEANAGQRRQRVLKVHLSNGHQFGCQPTHTRFLADGGYLDEMRLAADRRSFFISSLRRSACRWARWPRRAFGRCGSDHAWTRGGTRDRGCTIRRQQRDELDANFSQTSRLETEFSSRGLRKVN